MKRFFSLKFGLFGRFLFSWGFLKFILWAVTIIVLLYAEEDWRGARAWAETKAKWEAKGESFDFTKLIPPPIPASQNLGAIPLFRLEPQRDADGNSYLYDLVLRKALRKDMETHMPLGFLPVAVDWQRGVLPDLEKIHQGIAASYAFVFEKSPPSPDAMVQLDALYPFLSDLRTAAVMRPLCRFPVDTSVALPSNRSLELLACQILLSKVLTLHAILALNHGQSDLALEDIRTNFKLMSGAERDPSAVGGLVAIGMSKIGNVALYEGLALHAWNDVQLAEIEKMLKPIDFLPVYQLGFRSEAALAVVNMDSFKQEFRRQSLFTDIYEYLKQMGESDTLLTRLTPPWALGWFDLNKSQLVAFNLRQLSVVDAPAHRVFPQVVDDLQKQAQRVAAQWDAQAPWNILFVDRGPYSGVASQSFAQAQVWVDETRIAIALERYHLAKGVYPDSLDALMPTYVTELPHDIMNGELYHYKLRPDSTFLLYSVGWNEKDDGGKVVYEKDRPEVVDYQQGDWVWPTPKASSH